VKLVCPVLRLVLALLAGSPGSSKLVSQAADFCSAHQDLLARLLQEAAAPGACSVCVAWAATQVARRSVRQRWWAWRGPACKRCLLLMRLLLRPRRLCRPQPQPPGRQATRSWSRQHWQ
jgi:hypothetical protein